MTQRELIKILDENGLVLKTQVYENKLDTKIENITYNSKDCIKNSVFFVKGKNFKTEYVKDAVSNGAITIISENEYDTDVAGLVIVRDIRRAMVLVANVFFEKPYEGLKTVGITGTKGKTTTTYFIKNILDEYEQYNNNPKTGVISTVQTYTGKRDEESHLTTPEAIELQRYFREMVDSGINYVTMEVSSQAYKYDRIRNMTFDVGLFLNISEDHISDAEHPNFNDYLDSKLEFIKNCRNVVINRETDYYEAVENAAKNADKIITYGTEKSKEKSDYYVTNIRNDGEYIVFTVNSKDYSHDFKIKMKGRFNVENALASIVISHIHGVPDNIIEKGLLKTEVQGRMNVFTKNNVTVIVDYAHNKLSFTKLYESLKADYPQRRIISVGGGPGGKAYARRKDFGQIVGSNSDFVYLTAEDPQFEAVKSICEEIASYTKCPYEIIEDRKMAIEKAIGQANPGDVIVLLAKGEETYQKVKGVFVPYESDLVIAKQLLEMK